MKLFNRTWRTILLVKHILHILCTLYNWWPFHIFIMIFNHFFCFSKLQYWLEVIVFWKESMVAVSLNNHHWELSKWPLPATALVLGDNGTLINKEGQQKCKKVSSCRMCDCVYFKTPHLVVRCALNPAPSAATNCVVSEMASMQPNPVLQS